MSSNTAILPFKPSLKVKHTLKCEPNTTLTVPPRGPAPAWPTRVPPATHYIEIIHTIKGPTVMKLGIYILMTLKYK